MNKDNIWALQETNWVGNEGLTAFILCSKKSLQITALKKNLFYDPDLRVWTKVQTKVHVLYPGRLQFCKCTNWMTLVPSFFLFLFCSTQPWKKSNLHLSEETLKLMLQMFLTVFLADDIVPPTADIRRDLPWTPHSPSRVPAGLCCV